MNKTFVVVPLAAWYTVWNEGRFGGNAQLNPADLFGGVQPLVTQASTLNAAVDKVVSGNLNGSSTVLALWRDDPASVHMDILLVQPYHYADGQHLLRGEGQKRC